MAEMVQAPPPLETWRRFTRHRVGVVALGVVLVLFALAFLGRFLVAGDPFVQHRDAAYCPPQRVRIIDAEGRLTRPFVYGFERRLHPETFQWEYAVDESQVSELALFARGPVYRVLWLFDWDVHLIGTVDGSPVFFLGAPTASGATCWRGCCGAAWCRCRCRCWRWRSRSCWAP